MAIVSLVVSCSTPGVKDDPTGRSGEACGQNGRCSDGLTCCDGVCVEEGSAPSSCDSATARPDPAPAPAPTGMDPSCNRCPPTACEAASADPLTRDRCRTCYPRPCDRDASVPPRPAQPDAAPDAPGDAGDVDDDGATPDAHVDAPMDVTTEATLEDVENAPDANAGDASVMDARAD